MKKIAFIVISMFFVNIATAADQYTRYQKVGRISTNVETGGVNVAGESGGWSASGCSSATWAYAPPATADTKVILATALAAQNSGREVRFYGDCQSSGSNYFVLRYMEVK
jgi:hypothetical protein